MQHFFGLVALFCLLILLGSFAIENIFMIEPCILCTIQRIMFLSILIICTSGLVTSVYIKKLRPRLNLSIINAINWFFLSTATAFATIGALVAGRQSWLQIVSRFNISSCSGGLQELLKQYSFINIISMAIEGKLECSAIGIKILGLSLANWGLINFLIILLFGLSVIFKSFFRSC